MKPKLVRHHKKMNNKKKGILAFFLVVVVLLLGGATVYVATQMSERKSVAPTAPESKPSAAETVEIVWTGSNACIATGAATVAACVPSGTISCDPDCPTACGLAASTITTCTDSCGNATTKACSATAVCGNNGGWGAWSACNASLCGSSGTKSRVCDNPVPTAGGAECVRTDGTSTTESNRVETISCLAAACPTSTVTSVVVTTTVTKAPTASAAATVIPVVLTEAGVLDIPGVAAFGGGLILAIVGILLAL